MIGLFGTVDDDIKLARALTRGGSRLSNLEAYYNFIVEDFRHNVMEPQFESEGGRGGTAWPQLSDAYRARKAIEYPGRKILVRTGRLRDALVQGTGDLAVRRVTPDMMEVGASEGMWHQKGTPRMPARPPIALTEEDKGRWMKALHRFAYDVLEDELD